MTKKQIKIIGKALLSRDLSKGEVEIVVNKALRNLDPVLIVKYIAELFPAQLKRSIGIIKIEEE